MKRKGLFALVALLITALSLAGCGSKQSNAGTQSQTQEQKVLRYGVTMSPGSIDPTNLKDIYSYEMVRQSYNGLTDRTPQGNIIPGLAKSWQTTDGGKTYHFILEKGVKFHSGNELKASDVKFTFEYDLDPARDSSSSSYLLNVVGAQDILKGKTKELAGFKILNDYEFTVSFTQPEVYFPDYCSVESLYIVEKAAVEGKGENWWETMSAGTGPYKLAEFKKDEKTVFTVNDNYFKGKPAIAKIEFAVVPAEETAMNMYQNGDLDVISAPLGQLEKIKADPSLSKELVEYPIADQTYLGMTQNLYPPFQNIKVRQAIAMVINQDDIAKKIMQDTVYPLYGIIPVGFSVYDKNIPKPEYNLEKAKQLLKEAGYDGNNPLPQLTLSYTSSDKDIAEFIAEQLKQSLGWNVKLESPDFSTLLTQLKAKNVPFYIFGSTAAYGDARSLLYTGFHSAGRRNFSAINNAEFDKLLDQAATIASPEERGKLYLQAEKVLLNDFDLVPLYTSKSYLLIKPYVKGMKLSGLGMDIMDTVKIEK